jgi:Cu/Zn superoxide dismutase
MIGLIHAQCSRNQGPPAGVLNAVAVINGRTTNGSVITGKVTFSQASWNSTLVISANITGLDAGQGSIPHGLHIHQLGIQVWLSDAITTCNSAGAHFNPCNTISTSTPTRRPDTPLTLATRSVTTTATLRSCSKTE